MASVLIVEDEDLLQRNLTLYLARRGYTIAEADDVETAIEALEAFATPFDVILLDINLPDGTGWDVLRYLRERAGEPSSAPAARQQPRVIVMTAVRPAQCRLDEFRPAALLLKPFPMDALMRLLDRVLARRPRAEAMDTDGQESVSAQLSAGQRRGGDMQEGPVATTSRNGVGSPRAGSMHTVQTQSQPVNAGNVSRGDAELDVEDAFGDHDIEYWVRKGNKLVPATGDEVIQIREWGRESSALARLALWQRGQARPHPGFARLLSGVRWVERRLRRSFRPLGAGHEQEQRQGSAVKPTAARGHGQQAAERAT